MDVIERMRKKPFILGVIDLEFAVLGDASENQYPERTSGNAIGPTYYSG
jgi:hypothetical protein